MQGPKWPFLLILFICGPYVVICRLLGQVCTLGRAPRTKETLPDFRKWCRFTRHSSGIPRVDGLSTDPRFCGVIVKVCYFVHYFETVVFI